MPCISSSCILPTGMPVQSDITCAISSSSTCQWTILCSKAVNFSLLCLRLAKISSDEFSCSELIDSSAWLSSATISFSTLNCSVNGANCSSIVTSSVLSVSSCTEWSKPVFCSRCSICTCVSISLNRFTSCSIVFGVDAWLIATRAQAVSNNATALSGSCLAVI